METMPREFEWRSSMLAIIVQPKTMPAFATHWPARLEASEGKRIIAVSRITPIVSLTQSALSDLSPFSHLTRRKCCISWPLK